MEPIVFTKWNGDDGMDQYIKTQTGCKPFSGAGINYRAIQNTTILRSVDGTEYYDDNLENVNQVEYTLFGHNGDQDVSEKKFNEPLLNANKTKHIYLYRVSYRNNKKNWVWYGKYEITGQKTKQHPGKDGVMREIVLLSLSKVIIIKK